MSEAKRPVYEFGHNMPVVGRWIVGLIVGLLNIVGGEVSDGVFTAVGLKVGLNVGLRVGAFDFHPPLQFRLGLLSFPFTMSRSGVERSAIRSLVSSHIRNPFRPF